MTSETSRRSPIAVEFATPSDIDDMATLLGDTFDEWPDVPLADHLAWKMHSPILDSDRRFVSGSVVARDGEALVGTGVGVPKHVWIEHQRYAAIEGCSLAIEPGSSRTRTFFAMRRWIEGLGSEYDISMAISTNPVVVRAWGHAGHRPFGNHVTILLRPLDSRGLVADLRRRGSSMPRALTRVAAAQAFATFGRASHVGPRRGRALRIERLTAFDERTDRLFERVRGQFDFMVDRGQRYMDWRYLDQRSGDYVVWVATPADGETQDDELLGWVIATARGGRGLVSDLVAAPGEESVLEPLLNRAIRAFRESGLTSAVCWLPQQHPYRTALRRAGFVDTRTRPGITYRPERLPEEQLELLADPATKLHFTLGDSDHG